MVNPASIIKKILIQTTVRTYSPLRIGSGKTDGITDILILKDKQGHAFIPATSLAGVLRAKAASIYGEEAAQKVFGSVADDGNQSLITISDITLCSEDTQTVIHRDGVKINEITGVGEKGAKYDFEALDRGAEGKLLMEVTLRQCNTDMTFFQKKIHKNAPDMYSDMAYTIADILASGIQVGALTTKGYGDIKGQQPSCYVFDFSQKKAASDWLAYLDSQTLPSAVYTGTSRQHLLGRNEFYVCASFSLQNSLIIRDYDEESIPDQKNDDKIAAVQLTSDGDYVIPGTSIKGAIRQKAFDILMTLTGNNEAAVQEKLDNMMGFANEGKTNGKRSRFYIKDIYISKGLHAMKQTRNRIDRFTGGTIDNALFTDIPVWQNEKNMPVIHMEFSLKDCTEAEAGLLLLILRELWTGNLPLGGAKSIGRGVLKGQTCSIQYAPAETEQHTFTWEQADTLVVTGDKALLESYVQKLAGEYHE